MSSARAQVPMAHSWEGPWERAETQLGVQANDCTADKE